MSIVTRLSELKFKDICIRANSKIRREVSNKYLRNRDLKKETRRSNDTICISNRFVNIDYLDLEVKDESLRKICEYYLNHEFDLLGSGLTRVSYDMNCIGVEDNLYKMSLNIKRFDNEGEWLKNILLNSHLEYSKEIIRNIDKEYKYIDWQIDFKSGYRFDSKKWYKDQPIGKMPGVDIKVPWELGRMQHLVQMAVGAVWFCDLKEGLIKEFKNQVLDFIVSNPVRMGCNWNCTMDVGIRVSNWLIAYDIFSQIDKEKILDEKFCLVFAASVEDHARFIAENLEWNYGERANHYLANIGGLLFSSAYLPDGEESDRWLCFAIQELINELEFQFNKDGSNFEASTSYHRLSGEIVILGTALVYGVLQSNRKKCLLNLKGYKCKEFEIKDIQKFDVSNAEFFPDWYIERLFKCGKFTCDILKSNGEVPQIGDNDSGRFIKISGVGKFKTLLETKEYKNLSNYVGIDNVDEYFDENILNHESFIALENGLFNSCEFERYGVKFPIEKAIVSSLAKSKVLKNASLKEYKLIVEGQVDREIYSYFKEKRITYKEYGVEKLNIEKISSYIYEDFGICVFRNKDFYLSMYFGKIGQNGNGGHAHNDKLSVELSISGISIYSDPGTYMYTSIPSRRNEFRSIKAHNSPVINNEEQNEFKSLFSLKDESKCEVVEYTKSSVAVKLSYKTYTIIRKITILNDEIIIQDFSNVAFEQQFKAFKFYSNGYGKIIDVKNN